MYLNFLFTVNQVCMANYFNCDFNKEKTVNDNLASNSFAVKDKV